MKFVEDFYEDELDNTFDSNLVAGEVESVMEPEMAEVEVVLDEPTRMVDIDGSVVLAEPGDIITIKSESLKRIKQ